MMGNNCFVRLHITQALNHDAKDNEVGDFTERRYTYLDIIINCH
jgi:hypothetical protein